MHVCFAICHTPERPGGARGQDLRTHYNTLHNTSTTATRCNTLAISGSCLSATRHCTGPTPQNTLQHAPTQFNRRCNKLQHAATHCKSCNTMRIPCSYLSATRRCTGRTPWNTLQHATRCNILTTLCSCLNATRRCTGPRPRNTLQHAATHYNTPQHAATRCNCNTLTTPCAYLSATRRCTGPKPRNWQVKLSTISSLLPFMMHPRLFIALTFANY